MLKSYFSDIFQSHHLRPTTWLNTFLGFIKKHSKILGNISLSLILTLMLLSLTDEALAAKAKKILTGEEAELFDAWIKQKDGTQYGFGVSSPAEVGFLFKVIITQLVVWVGVFGFKIYDKFTGKGEQMIKDMREMKEAWLTAAHDIKHIKEHFMTEAEVANKVREEIKYLREHGSFLESPGRRSGSREG